MVQILTIIICITGVQGTSIDTRGFRSLLDLVDNTNHDSFDLYYGLFMYNQVRDWIDVDSKVTSWSPMGKTEVSCGAMIPSPDLASEKPSGPAYAQRYLAELEGFCLAQNATEELARLEQCFDYVKKQLFDRMHNTVRAQLFHAGSQPPLLGAASGIGAPAASPPKLLPEQTAAGNGDGSGGGGGGNSGSQEADEQKQLQLNGSSGTMSRL